MVVLFVWWVRLSVRERLVLVPRVELRDVVFVVFGARVMLCESDRVGFV